MLEEINTTTRGGKHGWSHLEGTACYTPRTNCAPERFITPLHSYPRTEGASILGGFVYRGKAIPSLVGRYVYSDLVSGRIWVLALDGTRTELLFDTEHNKSSFGEDTSCELYPLSCRDGVLYKITKVYAPFIFGQNAVPNFAIYPNLTDADST